MYSVLVGLLVEMSQFKQARAAGLTFVSLHSHGFNLELMHVLVFEREEKTIE